MNAVWLLAAFFLGFLSVVLHSLVVRGMDPADRIGSMRRFWLFFVLRLGLIGLFLWQLVQQDLWVVLLGVILFLLAYASSLYYILRWKPQWFRSEIKKDNPVWMQ